MRVPRSWCAKGPRLGAYPVIEYNGLIFAYLGHPDRMPEFPVYDTLEIEDMTMRPYEAPYKCNWIQVLDAIMDPVHTTFLHSQNSHPQFSEGMAQIGELKFFERNENHFLGSSTRRVGDNAWVRLNELILPNFTQAGAAFAADGTEQRYFGRSAFTRWVVPVDDENSIVFAWANFGRRGDPHQYNTQEGCELIEQGEILDRSPEEKQRYPADSEAVEGMGAISTHMGENPDADRSWNLALPPPHPPADTRIGGRKCSATASQTSRSVGADLWPGYCAQHATQARRGRPRQSDEDRRSGRRNAI